MPKRNPRPQVNNQAQEGDTSKQKLRPRRNADRGSKAYQSMQKETKTVKGSARDKAKEEVAGSEANEDKEGTLTKYHPRPIRPLRYLDIDYGEEGVPIGSVFDPLPSGSHTWCYRDESYWRRGIKRGVIENLCLEEQNYYESQIKLGEDAENILVDIDNHRRNMFGEAINAEVEERLTDLELLQKKRPVMESARYVEWATEFRKMMEADEGMTDK